MIIRQRLARHFFEHNDVTQKEIADVVKVDKNTISKWVKDLGKTR